MGLTIQDEDTRLAQLRKDLPPKEQAFLHYLSEDHEFSRWEELLLSYPQRFLQFHNQSNRQINKYCRRHPLPKIEASKAEQVERVIRYEAAMWYCANFWKLYDWEYNPAFPELCYTYEDQDIVVDMLHSHMRDLILGEK